MSKPTMTRQDVAYIMERFFEDCQGTREQGQKEYAHDEDNALANFERTAERTGVSREQAWAVFAGKHWDGIMAHVKGHKSQREPVQGRIKDLVVYLVLYLCMVEQDAATPEETGIKLADLAANFQKNTEFLTGMKVVNNTVSDPNDR